MNSKTKTCQNCKAGFVIEPEDFEFYEKIDVPEPTFCPDCRLQRRFVFRNEGKLHKRKCDFSNKNIISIYHKDSPYKVYDQKIWWSDKWDALKYGRDYNFNKPLFEQFRELMKEVPWFNLINVNPISSGYVNFTTGSKNCYLIFAAGAAKPNEDCMYGYRLDGCKDCLDSAYVVDIENCHEVIDMKNCYRVFWSRYVENCFDCAFLYDCKNCSHCFGCVGLRNRQYQIFNEQYTKKKYQKKIIKFNLGSYSNILDIRKKLKKIILRFPHKYANIIKSYNAFGDNISNSRNCFNCFFVANSENCQFIIDSQGGVKDSYDVSNGKGELLYEDSATFGASRVNFASIDISCCDSNYVMQCFSSSNLFACVGLRHKQYCILNKQYTKEEYRDLVPKIKKHMNEMPYTDKKGRIYKYGEFFPMELSPFAYNETIANEYFPLTKEQAIEQGYSWYDKPKNEYKPTIKAKDLPDNIKDVNKDILKEIIECGNHSSETKVRPFERDLQKGLYSKGLTLNKGATSKRSLLERSDLDNNKSCAGSGVFRIIPQELKFYQKMNLPLPHLCPDCRHRERIKQRNPLKLWKRQCMKKGCKNTFQTTYSPDRKEIVYCEECYNKEVG